MKPTLELVVPCFNEAARLDLNAFRAFLESESSARVLFVDDGSSDGTSALLQAFSAQHPPGRAEILTLQANVGKAEAVRQGMLHALKSDATLVGFWDADLATPLDAVFDLVGVLIRRSDIDWVLGARVQLLGRDIRRKAIRHYLGRVFATAASLVLAMPVYDTQCGAKIFRASAELHEVLARPFVSRWIFDVEMLMRLSRIRQRDARTHAAASVFEYPLQQWMDVGGSKVKGGDFLKAALELVRIWRASPSTSPVPLPIASTVQNDPGDK